MGRELQKKKNRSSVPKKRQKPKSKKIYNPRSNPVIAANWDHSLSIAQNYRNLGLTSRLNHRTGGVEQHHKLYKNSNEAAAMQDDALAIGGKRAAKLQVGEVSVVRDPETGRILEVIGSDADAAEDVNPLNDPITDIENTYDGKAVAAAEKPRKRVVQQLEDLAAQGEEKRPRKQSQREQEWIERLISKHGDDYRAMSRDLKLNRMQQSEGQIRARILQWKMLRGLDQIETSPMVVIPPSKSDSDVEENAHFDDTKPRCTCTKKFEDY